MLELLLTVNVKPPLVRYPDSGPGDTYLNYGNEDIGFFSTIDNIDFFTPDSLLSQLNYTPTGTIARDSTTWLKLLVDGKFLFLPNRPYVVSSTWSELYNNGLVNGSDDTGYPANLTPVNQLRYVTFGTDVFKVRLLKTDSVNPVTWTGTQTIPNGNTMLGEWGRIVSHIYTPVPSGYTGINWKLFDANTFGKGTALNWGLNSNTTPVGNRTNFAMTTVGNAAGTTAAAWWPVLEYVPGDERPLFPVNNQQTDLQLNSRPLIPTYGTPTGVLLPVMRKGSAAFTTVDPLLATTSNVAIIEAIPRTGLSYQTEVPLPLIPTITFE